MFTASKCTIFLVATCYLLLSIDAATVFNAPKGVSVVCTDLPTNVCSAPTSCNRNGQVTLDSGNSFNVGQPSTMGGIWKISGGYKITFPVACNITCQGECTCESCPETDAPDFDTSAVASEEQPTSAAASSLFTPVVSFMAVWTLFWML